MAFFNSPWTLAACIAAALVSACLIGFRVAWLLSGGLDPAVHVTSAGSGDDVKALSAVALPPGLVSALKPSEIVPRAPSVQLSRRFRLVGSMSSGTGESEVWTAILDDNQLHRQLRAKPGDEILPRCKVVETGPSFARVETPDGVQVIGRGEMAASGASSRASPRSAGGGSPYGEGLDAFGGRQIEEHRWEFSREALMDYYRELMANSDRLVTVFDSLEPNYTGDGKIDGYRLNILGEADFFKSVGFNQDDIVRVVNGVEMTNRRRAESFIRRVVEDGLDTLVIEYDRGDEKLKNIYQTF